MSAGTWRDKARRVRALMVKETRQVIRDPSSIAIGVVLPMILILLFGYGLSLDVKNVPIAVVVEDPGPAARELVAGFQLSPYFHAQITHAMQPAEKLMLERSLPRSDSRRDSRAVRMASSSWPSPARELP